jgi:hypothetical protein
VGHPGSEQRATTVARLAQLREAGSLSLEHIRLAAVACVSPNLAVP